MARSRRSSRSGNVISVNFKGVEGKRPRVPPGEYLAKVIEVSKEEGDKAEYLAWKFEVIEGKSEGATLYYNTSLSKQALWNLRGLLEALGEEVPDSEMDIDIEGMTDKEVMLIVDDEEYEGKTRSKVVDFAPAEEPEKPAARGSKGGKEDKGSSRSSRRGKEKKKKLTQDEVNDMSQEELEATAEEHDLDIDFKGLKILRKMKAAVIDALDEKELLED